MSRFVDDDGDAELDYSVALSTTHNQQSSERDDEIATGWTTAVETTESWLGSKGSRSRSSGTSGSRRGAGGPENSRRSRTRHQTDTGGGDRGEEEDATVGGEFMGYAVPDDSRTSAGDAFTVAHEVEDIEVSKSKSSEGGNSGVSNVSRNKPPTIKEKDRGSSAMTAKVNNRRARSSGSPTSSPKSSPKRMTPTPDTPDTSLEYSFESTPPRNKASNKGGGGGSPRSDAPTPTDRDKNNKRKWTMVAVGMMALGLAAVVLGVIFGLGLIDVGGSNGGGDASSMEDFGGVASGSAGVRTTKPTISPTDLPTAAPTSPPTSNPTTSRPTTVGPTSSPTPLPTTDQPTISPTDPPTAQPTDPFRTEPEPSNPPLSYFNYRPGGPRGPDNWATAIENGDAVESDYWEEWEDYIDKNIRRNRCGRGRQSPIDVRFDQSLGQCFEYHEIRHEMGEFSVMNPMVDAQILPSKLRIVYPQVFDEDCAADWANMEFNEELMKDVCKDNIKGPSADIPKGWAYQMPVLHVDIKIPSEHYIEGKQYAAEYQINLIMNTDAKRGAPVVSILFDLHPDNVPNSALQVVLDRFQMEYDADLMKCEANRRRTRRVESALAEALSEGRDQGTWMDEPEEEEHKFQSYLRKSQRDLEQTYTRFDPWDGEIMRSVWFFGYEGSLTEPPCTEFVEWHIIDKPALISAEQLTQMQTLLFKHVDRNCRRTSVHYEGSVARPLQPYNDRLVHRCMCRDFIADSDRKKYGSGRCKWNDRDIFGFDENVFTDEWFESTHQYETEKHERCGVFGECEAWEEELAEREAAAQAAAAAAGPGGAEKGEKEEKEGGDLDNKILSGEPVTSPITSPTEAPVPSPTVPAPTDAAVNSPTNPWWWDP